MKVDAKIDQSHTSQRYQTVAPGRSTPASFSEALLAAKAGEGNGPEAVKTADFTGMARQDLKDWINAQIGSGAMSLDESTAFVGLTLNGIRVGALTPAAEDGDRFNYMEIMEAGIAGARFRRDPAEVLRLEKALQTMQQHQSGV